MHGLIGSFGGGPFASPSAPGQQAGAPSVKVATRETGKPAPSDVVFADFPLPPARPAALVGTAQEEEDKQPEAKQQEGRPADVPLPPARPASLSLAYTRPLPVAARLRLMGGAAPILSSNMFVAFNAIRK
jgi:hypothetical protein